MGIATTIRLSPGLSKRIEALAKAAGKTAEEWTVDTLTREEQRQSFRAEARKSLAAVALGAPTWDAEDVFAYVRAKVAGRRVKRPLPRPRDHSS